MNEDVERTTTPEKGPMHRLTLPSRAASGSSGDQIFLLISALVPRGDKYDGQRDGSRLLAELLLPKLEACHGHGRDKKMLVRLDHRYIKAAEVECGTSHKGVAKGISER